jgi:hypothetical protein
VSSLFRELSERHARIRERVLVCCVEMSVGAVVECHQVGARWLRVERLDKLSGRHYIVCDTIDQDMFLRMGN